MRLAVTLAALVPLSASAADFTIVGACPGDVDVDITNATPDGTVAVIASTGPGTAVIPGGPCAGQTVDLDGAGLKVLKTLTADGAGSISLSRALPAQACSRWLQTVDLASCEASQVVYLSDLDGDGATADVDCDDNDPAVQDCGSCRDIFEAGLGATDGIYTIDPDLGGPDAPFDAWCDMAGGGWTLLGKQVANMSPTDCSNRWTGASAAGSVAVTPMPGSDSGTTARFPFSVFNQLAANHPEGAYRLTSSRADAYVAYWSAACTITDWDNGTPECYQDFADEALTMPNRASTRTASHGVLQGYNGNGGFSDVRLSYTTFQACNWTPAVGWQQGGVYQGYRHNAGLMVWFK